MATKGKKADAGKSRGRVKVGKLGATKELSTAEQKKVKGGGLAQTAQNLKGSSDAKGLFTRTYGATDDSSGQ